MSIGPTIIPGLRSPYEMVGGLVYFGRMLDKIRLHAENKLPENWVVALGLVTGFDGSCCRFLRIPYPELKAETLKGGTDENLLEWVFQRGYRPEEHEIEAWNAFSLKRGWRDKYAVRVRTRLEEAGLPTDAVVTMFDFIDLDEGRPLRFATA